MRIVAPHTYDVNGNAIKGHYLIESRPEARRHVRITALLCYAHKQKGASLATPPLHLLNVLTNATSW